MTAVTYRSILDRLLVLGILPADRAQAAYENANMWTDDLDNEVPPDQLPDLLHAAGVAASVNAFESSAAHIPEVQAAYEELLIEVAALSGGSVVVTDVVFDPEAPDGRPLRFRRNGEPVA